METCVSMVLLASLMTASAMMQAQTGEMNRYQHTRRRCISAGQATLDSITATGQPLADPDVQRLWPGVSVRITRTPGKGDWAGLTLVKAVASATSRRKDVRITLARYVAPTCGDGRRR